MENSNHWIFFSPHLDDAVLSCGGLIWELTRMGSQVEIWTIFAGDPPSGRLTPFAQSLHDRWGTGIDSVLKRREEDEQACAVLHAKPFHFAYPDCIYRYTSGDQPVIRGEEDLFQEEYGGEEDLVEQLSAQLQCRLPENVIVAAPYGIGRHIDHQIVVRVVQKIRREAWTYADYPYAASMSPEKTRWTDNAGKSYLLPVGQAALAKWQTAIAAYASQISTFWQSLEQMRAGIEAYWRSGEGSLLRDIW